MTAALETICMTRYVHTATDPRGQVGAEIQRESVQALCPGADLRSLEKKDVVLFTKLCYLLGKPCAQGIVTPTKAGGECFSNLHRSIIQTNSMPEYE